jgi:uncharacterized repeat protein (TIGR01451 family)
MLAIAMISATTFLLLFCVTSVPTAQAADTKPNLVQPIPSLMLTHTSNVTAATFHDLIEYQVSVYNSSLVTATNLTLTVNIPFPIETTYMTGTLTTSSGNVAYDADVHAIRWHGAVPAQGQVVITYTIKLTEFITCKTLNSLAFLTVPSLSTPLFAVAKVEYRCPRIKALQFTMSASVTQTTPGSMIDYRLTLTNSSDVPTDRVQIENSLPFGASFVIGSAIATSDIITYEPTFKELRWAGVLPERSTVQLSFQVRVRDRIQCGAILNNQATVYNTDFMQPSTPTIQAQTTVTCTESQPWSDFGDAPDSDSNHHNMNNTAYPDTGVLGHFPTVWEGTPPNEASGPTHQLGYFWLGDGITAEVDADLNLSYENDFTNILYNGKEDVADLDDDDGWRNRQVPLLNCETATLIVRIRRSNLPTTIERLWLNVWFDGNRDGDWQDSGDCPGLIEPLRVKSFEWLVQDWPIDANQIPVNDYVDLQIPTKLIYNTDPTSLVWLRFTLSEQPALRPTGGGMADGHGPAYPDLFQIGETEDYLAEGLPAGDPISVTLEVQDGASDGETIPIGSRITAIILLTPETGMMPAPVTVRNQLPAEIALVGQPELYLFDKTEDHILGPDNGATPLVATFLANEGPSGQIQWRGQLVRGVEILIAYEAEVKACPPPDENGQTILHNVAQIRQFDGTIVNDKYTYLVDCMLTDEELLHLYLPLVNH